MGATSETLCLTELSFVMSLASFKLTICTTRVTIVDPFNDTRYSSDVRKGYL